jgi:hypothetical protein
MVSGSADSFCTLYQVTCADLYAEAILYYTASIAIVHGLHGIVQAILSILYYTILYYVQYLPRLLLVS